MIITVFGATGMVGKQVVHQALAKSYKVIAFGRDIKEWIDADLANENFTAIKGYVFDSSDVEKAIKPANAIVSCLGGNIDGTDKTRSRGIKTIIAAMQKLGKQRIVGIGGMGVLQANEEKLILEMEDYPKEYEAVGLEHLQAYKYLQSSNLAYTFICPPNIINKPATENYLTQKNYHPSNNNYEIAAGDIAHFILKCIENELFVGDRVGICDKIFSY